MQQSVNPANEELIREYPEHDWDFVAHAAMKARDTFELWRQSPFDHRANAFKYLANLLKKNKAELGLLITREMGKPVAQAEAEVEKCAVTCEYYAKEGGKFLEERIIQTDATHSSVRFEPLGVILGVMPWNFPFWQVLRFAIPTILAGNVALLKHASNVQGCAFKIQELFQEAKFPDGIFQNLSLSQSNVERLIGTGWVAGVSLTGSNKAGQSVASHAGRALIKTVLELGGSDPFIILGDADLKKIMPSVIRSRMQNTGQSCIAAKRFIVDETIFDEFIRQTRQAILELKTGDPSDRSINVGPLARRDLRDQIADQVQRAMSQGAELICGGAIPMKKGFFFEPTLLKGPGGKSVCFTEELFGPVLFALPFSDRDEAIELANTSPFGLGASIWTQNTQNAKEMIPHIDAGSVFINEVVQSNPLLPFGGVKQSGYGRELSDFGMREFVNVKTIFIR